MVLFLTSMASLAASAQYIDTTGGSQIYVNQPANAAQPGNIMPSAGMMPGVAAYGAANAGAGAAVPNANFAQQPYPYADPYAGAVAPAACGVPFTAAPVVPCGPFTSGFSYSAQQASAFGPFTPPVAEAAEQFYQYPGLTPFGAYPGAGYAAAGGVGFDPISGYYGPYGGVVPLV